jgi:hypothetical protein
MQAGGRGCPAARRASDPHWASSAAGAGSPRTSSCCSRREQRHTEVRATERYFVGAHSWKRWQRARRASSGRSAAATTAQRAVARPRRAAQVLRDRRPGAVRAARAGETAPRGRSGARRAGGARRLRLLARPGARRSRLRERQATGSSPTTSERETQPGAACGHQYCAGVRSGASDASVRTPARCARAERLAAGGHVDAALATEVGRRTRSCGGSSTRFRVVRAIHATDDHADTAFAYLARRLS